MSAPLHLSITRPEVCDTCGGEGFIDGPWPQATCSTCRGYGQTIGCPLCNGKGCWDCGNTGRVAGP